MSTAAVVYLTHPYAFDLMGGQTLAERFVKTLVEVRNIDATVVVQSSKAEGFNPQRWVDELGCACKVLFTGWDAEPDLTDQMCVDAFGHCLDGEAGAPQTIVACVPYMPFLTTGAIELCVRKLGHHLWSGPSQAWPAVIPYNKGGSRRQVVAGYLGGVRAFKSVLRNEAKPWDNTFGGVTLDAVEALNVIRPADRKLAEALLAG